MAHYIADVHTALRVARVSLAEGFRLYHSLFGVRGVLLAAAARLSGETILASVEIPGLPHSVFLRLRTTDVGVCQEVLLRGQYDCELPRNPRVIVDAGANVGLTSVFYANKYPDAAIIAIEPERSNFEILSRNVAPYPSIRALHAALWSENSEVEITDPHGTNTEFRVSGERGAPANGAQIVRGITVDRLMREFDVDFIDLLKLDIEGAEKEVLLRSSEWSERVGVIAVEIHDWIHEGSSASIRDATRDFPVEWSRGEITYRAKSDWSGSASATASGSAPALASSAPGRPLKIRRA